MTTERLFNYQLELFESQSQEVVNKIDKLFNFTYDLRNTESNLTQILIKECGKLDECRELTVSQI